MATTPTYSWPLPDDTDLVKDGAEAIRDLGNAIDTTVGGLSGAGLVHINETTWSSSSSVNINNVFTSDYRFYRLIFDTTGASLGDATIRLRASGTDNTGTDYNQGFSSLTTANNTVTGASNVATSWNFMKLNNVGNCSAAIDIYNPQVSGANTMATCNWSGATSVLLGGYSWLFLNNTTSYDGLTIAFTSSTGRVKIYGYGG